MEVLYVKCYDSNDIVPFYLQKRTQNYLIPMQTLHVPIEEHVNIMDERTQGESIAFELSESIVTNDFSNEYNDAFGIKFN